MAEIQLLWERLSVSRRFSGSASEWLIQLHSSVAPADQRRAFQRPPKGIRKVCILFCIRARGDYSFSLTVQVLQGMFVQHDAEILTRIVIIDRR